MTRVLIVEDQRMMREDMENYLSSSGRYQLVRSIANAKMAEEACRNSGAQLILMDVCTENDESGFVATAAIKASMPQVKVVIVTSMVECGFLDRARAVGADSFWYKDTSCEELLAVMDRTMNGESVAECRGMYLLFLFRDVSAPSALPAKGFHGYEGLLSEILSFLMRNK